MSVKVASGSSNTKDTLCRRVSYAVMVQFETEHQHRCIMAGWKLNETLSTGGLGTSMELTGANDNHIEFLDRHFNLVSTLVSLKRKFDVNFRCMDGKRETKYARKRVEELTW